MKTKITLFAILFTVLGFAQNGINYKAVIKDNLGNVVANQAVKIRFTILKGAANVYQETHLTMTDANGIAIVNIGLGTYVSGSFTNIIWGAGAHSLKVEIDPAGGNTFVPMGTTEFKAVPYALNVTGLEAIDEGEGIGWRLKGRNPDNYGNIGDGAVDLSISRVPSTTRGATTDYSMATGLGTTASGDSSSSFGVYSLASGQIATAFGEETIARAYASMALGSYNIGFGDGNPLTRTNPILEIGNGTSAIRSNALTVLKKGNVGIGNHMPASLLEVAHKNGLPTPTNVTNAFSIRNIGAANDPNDDESWQFYVDDGGTLLLYRKGAYRGYFNSTSGAYVQASDVRLKKDILPLEASTLQKVMQLNPVSYQMKDQNDDERQIGLISQEVQEVFPSLTHLVPGQDILSLSYTEMIPILIKAIQEQQELIKSMQSAVGSQQSVVKSQETKIESLTASSEQKDASLKSFDNRLKQMEISLKQIPQ